MKMQNTLYIAEPIFSEKLQSYDSAIAFPPIKKIGITTDHPNRREKELLGTTSPVKIAIVKAWTNIDARSVETMLHTMPDNSRLDGEYFWDGNETLVDAVSRFIAQYHPDSEEILIDDDIDVKAATKAANTTTTSRIYAEVVPTIADLGLKYSFIKNGKALRIILRDYNCVVGAKTGDRYTFTIFSKTKTSDEALSDFPESQELSAHASDDSNRKARIPLTSVDVILNSIKTYAGRS